MISVTPRLTGAGENVLIRAISGEQMRFTSFGLGAGRDEREPRDVEALVEQMMKLPITRFEETEEEGYVLLTASFENAAVAEAFEWREFGVYCQTEAQQQFVGDGNRTVFALADRPGIVYRAGIGASVATITGYNSETGEVTLETAPEIGATVTIVYPDPAEKLYAYCCDESGETLRPASGSGVVSEQSITLLIYVGDAEFVSAQLTDGSTYASQAALNAHVSSRDNPHGVTKEQIGLGRVVNAAPAEMVPGFVLPKELTVPQSTDSMSELVGKLHRTIEALKSHFTADDPHHTKLSGDGGIFVGNGSVKRLINLGFRPSMVYLCNAHGTTSDDVDGVCGGLCFDGAGITSRACTNRSHEETWNDSHTALMVAPNGFYVNYNFTHKVHTNVNGMTYRYIVFR